MLFVKQALQVLISFAVAGLVGYVFGFHLLFAHTAFEIFYYAGLFFGTYVIGELLFNKILRINTVVKTT